MSLAARSDLISHPGQIDSHATCAAHGRLHDGWKIHGVGALLRIEHDLRDLPLPLGACRRFWRVDRQLSCALPRLLLAARVCRVGSSPYGRRELQCLADDTTSVRATLRCTA